MKPSYSSPNDTRHLVFYNLLSNSQTYGILSAKKIPEIPSFPIFMNVGNLQINLKSNNELQFLSKAEIELLQSFHTLVFNQILKVIKQFMIFDTSNTENSFLVVPSKYIRNKINRLSGVSP